MIYCVVPQALADELYDQLVEHYREDPNVKVIVDRRGGPDRRSGYRAEGAERRRARARGSFPPIDAPS